MQLKKTYNLSLQSIIILLFAVFILGGFLFFLGLNAVLPNFQKSNTSHLNALLPNLKKLFEEKTSQNVETIKVVDEQSQVIEVVKKASPAVVSIVASAEVPKFETYYGSPFADLLDEFQQFFNFRIPRQRQNGTEKKRVGAGTVLSSQLTAILLPISMWWTTKKLNTRCI